MNLHLDQQMADLGDSVTTLSVCLPANAVVVPRMYNPLPARILHSFLSCGSRTAVSAGRRRTQ